MELSLGVQVLVSQVFPLGAHIGFNVVGKSSWGHRGAPLKGMGAQRRTPCTVDMCPTLLAAVAGKVGHMSSGKALPALLFLSPVWLKALSCSETDKQETTKREKW